MIEKLKVFIRRIHIFIKHRPTILIINPKGMAMIREHHAIPFFSIFINKKYRGQGYGIKLLGDLFEKSKQKYNCIFGIILKDNSVMQHICKKVGFKIVGEVKKSSTEFEWDLMVKEFK